MKIGYVPFSEVNTKVAVAHECSDEQLLVCIVRKDRAALAEMYQRFQRPLFSYLFHLLGQREIAEEVLQDVMLIVWQKAHTYQNFASVSSWMFGIAHHQSFKVLRKQRGPVFLQLEAALHIPNDDLAPEADMMRHIAHDELKIGLACLTIEHREVLELAFFQDFSCKEIASIVGIPEGTVKSRLSYARRALKAALVRNGWEE